MAKIKKNKIYLVSEGEYSDYHYVAAFSTKEKAKKFQTLFGPYGVNEEIEVMEIDRFEKQLTSNKQRWNVRMKKDGNVESCLVTLDCFDKLQRSLGWKVWICSDGREWIDVFCWARNERHAIKIANDLRCKLIALNRWVEDWE